MADNFRSWPSLRRPTSTAILLLKHRQSQKMCEFLQSQSAQVILTSKASWGKRKEKRHGHSPLYGHRRSTITTLFGSTKRVPCLPSKQHRDRDTASDAYRGFRRRPRPGNKKATSGLWSVDSLRGSSSSKRQIRPSNSLACLAA